MRIRNNPNDNFTGVVFTDLSPSGIVNSVDEFSRYAFQPRAEFIQGLWPYIMTKLYSLSGNTLKMEIYDEGKLHYESSAVFICTNQGVHQFINWRRLMDALNRVKPISKWSDSMIIYNDLFQERFKRGTHWKVPRHIDFHYRMESTGTYLGRVIEVHSVVPGSFAGKEGVFLFTADGFAYLIHDGFAPIPYKDILSYRFYL